MIFEYAFLDGIKEFQFISEFIPSPHIGLVLSSASVLLFVLIFRLQIKQNFRTLDWTVLLTCSLAILGIYIFSIRWIDEVFVNLEHPYNLLHHGRFSYSPFRMVDGTVEFVYHLLLTPFSQTPKSVVQSNFLLGFLIYWLHLFLIWKLLGKQQVFLKFFLLLIFTLSLPLAHIFASGFGNGLISLLLMFCFYWQYLGNPERSLSLASAMPLVRPDAILYSFSVFFQDTLSRQKLPKKYILLSLLSGVIYSSFVRLFYGHWVPTPVSFKSFKLSMLPLINWSALQYVVINWASHPVHVIFIISLILSFLVPISERLSALRLYTVPLIAIFLFYTATNTLFIFNLPYADRYYVGTELFVTLFPILFLKEMAVLLIDQQNSKLRLNSPPKVTIACLTLAVTFMFLVNRAYAVSQPPPIGAVRVDGLGFHGQVVDAVVPKDWTVSTTELNTFGFMIHDREIIDLWGYTNPEIAHSKICNEEKVRVNPAYFMEQKPDVFWYWYLSTLRPGDSVEFWLQSFNTGKRFNQLGDMNQVMQNYDIFRLVHSNFETYSPDQWSTFSGTYLFIRRDRTQEFVKILDEKGYAKLHERPFNFGFFQWMYNNSPPPVKYPCG